MRREEEVFECDAEAIDSSDSALKCFLETGETKWIPNTVIHDDSEVFAEGHSGKLVLRLWWAQKEKLA
jgi:hypothetical protein